MDLTSFNMAPAKNYFSSVDASCVMKRAINNFKKARQFQTERIMILKFIPTKK